MWSSPSPDGSTQYCLIKSPSKPQFGHAMSRLTGLSGLNKLEQDKWTLELVRFFFPHKAEQSSITALAGSPPTYPWGCDLQGHKDKQKTKSHLCLFLHYCSWQSQHENPPEALWGVCRVATGTCTLLEAAQFCPRKEALAYLLNRTE